MGSILLYKWGSLLEPILENNMIKAGEKCVCLDYRSVNYRVDAAFSMKLMEKIHENQVKAVFSYDYFPVISEVCEIVKIPYIAWLYDCPLYTTYSDMIRKDYTYLFAFDAVDAQQIAERGGANVYHFPLGVDADLFENKGKIQKAKSRRNYDYEVSFVGNFYKGSKNRLLGAKFTDYTKGFAEGLLLAQSKILGSDFLLQSLSSEVVTEISSVCSLQTGELFPVSKRELVADALRMELSRRERIEVVKKALEVSDIYLFTGEELPEELAAYVHDRSAKVPEGKISGEKTHEKDSYEEGSHGKDAHKIYLCGSVSYTEEMPGVFGRSKINLNMTARGIQSGIPQRVLDVLGSGGFLITNYQPEIAEYFRPGVDLVMYEDISQIPELISYYLNHDEEREEIAENGLRAVRESFLLQNRLKSIFEIVFGNE